jgi:hypothetical protein
LPLRLWLFVGLSRACRWRMACGLSPRILPQRKKNLLSLPDLIPIPIDPIASLPSTDGNQRYPTVDDQSPRAETRFPATSSSCGRGRARASLQPPFFSDGLSHRRAHGAAQHPPPPQVGTLLSPWPLFYLPRWPSTRMAVRWRRWRPPLLPRQHGYGMSRGGRCSLPDAFTTRCIAVPVASLSLCVPCTND